MLSLATAVELAEEFAALVRERKPECLDPWLQRAQDSTVPALQRFAKRMSLNYDAVRAAVNGQVGDRSTDSKPSSARCMAGPALTYSNAGSCSQPDHQNWPRPHSMA